MQSTLLLCIFMLIICENYSCIIVQTCWILLVSHLAYTLCSVICRRSWWRYHMGMVKKLLNVTKVCQQIFADIWWHIRCISLSCILAPLVEIDISADFFEFGRLIWCNIVIFYYPCPSHTLVTRVCVCIFVFKKSYVKLITSHMLQLTVEDQVSHILAYVWF